MPPGSSPSEEHTRSRGVDLSTLIVASIAATVAAVVTSKLWHAGTVISTAMTPVIVALCKEWLQRPVEKVTEVARAPIVAVRSTPLRAPAYARQEGPPEAEREGRVIEPQRPDTDEYERLETVLPPGEDPDPETPYRVYRRRPSRRAWWKAGLVTGVLAFVVAAIVLTVPELVGGKSVTGSGSTTLFGHSSSSTNKNGSDQNGSSTSTAPSSSQSPSSSTPSQHSTPSTKSTPSGSGQQQSPPSSSGSGSGGSTPSQPSAPKSAAPAAPSGGGSSAGGQ